MERLRARRWLFWALVLVTALLIRFLEAKYFRLQEFADADEFRSRLSDGDDRYIAAGIVDLVLAVEYGLAALSTSIRSRLSVAGGICVLVAALADEFENVCLLRNIERTPNIDAGAIHIMRVFGETKWALIIVGALALITAYAWGHRARVKSWFVGSSSAG